MTKKFLAAVAGAALAIALVGGFSAALASKGENSGRGHRDILVQRQAKQMLSEFVLKGNGGARIKKAPVTRVGTSDFDVTISGITFTIQTTTATRFIGGSAFADLAIGKIIDARGAIDPANLRILRADQVKVRQTAAR